METSSPRRHTGNCRPLAPGRFSYVLEANFQSPEAGWKETDAEGDSGIDFPDVAENPTWGAPRIHGELLMLGFDLSERTISRWMKRAPRGPDQAKCWLAFLRNHREAIVAMDLGFRPQIYRVRIFCGGQPVQDQKVLS